MKTARWLLGLAFLLDSSHLCHAQFIPVPSVGVGFGVRGKRFSLNGYYSAPYLGIGPFGCGPVGGCGFGGCGWGYPSPWFVPQYTNIVIYSPPPAPTAPIIINNNPPPVIINQPILNGQGANVEREEDDQFLRIGPKRKDDLARRDPPPADPEERPRPRPIEPRQPPKPPEKKLDPQPPQQPKDPYEDLIAQGRDAFANQEYGRAERFWLRATSMNPDRPLGHFLLAQAYLSRGRYQEAVASIHAGMRLRLEWPQVHFRIAELYGDNFAEDFPDHLRQLHDAASRHPEDPTLLFLLGYQLWFTDRKDDARPYFQKAARFAPDTTFIDRFLGLRRDPAPVVRR